jgi:hypothetical protein
MTHTALTNKQQIEQAVNTIVKMRTLPPQIDFISYFEKVKLKKAEQLINSLPNKLKAQYSKIIDKQVEEYYDSNIQGENSQFYSAAKLNAMF